MLNRFEYILKYNKDLAIISFKPMSHWIFKNGFSSKLVNNSHIFLNQQKFKKFESYDDFGKLIYSNMEIIKYKSSIIRSPYIQGNLNIIENEWLYPFPNNYIPKFYQILKLNLNIRYFNNNYSIKEYMKINLHKPSPYEMLCTYKLVLNNNFIESRKIRGPMNYKTINSGLFSNYKAKELFIFMQSELQK